MGAGKSTLGPELATRLGRPFVSVDARVEGRVGASITEVFSTEGEKAFRVLEEEEAVRALAGRELSVVELGGGAPTSERTRAALAEGAFTLLVETTPDEAWARVSGSDRPLAVEEEAFEALYRERQALYDQVADGRARDVEGAVLAAAGVHLSSGALDDLAALVPGVGPVELVVDGDVGVLYGTRITSALRGRLAGSHVVPAGEAAKRAVEAERLWSALRVGRDGFVVAVGGGVTTDLAGFVAATYLRGIDWVVVPTTLVGQIDAAIGGKTAIDLEVGKNLVGAFHWPARAIVDPEVLETLPPGELESGLAEVVKTGLLTGEELWERPLAEQVRRCATFKAAICLRDPLDRGERRQLNLGHTFAHALEAASGYALPHGRAVGLGLLGALRLSGLDEIALDLQQVLGAEPVRVDGEAAWSALHRDKKAAGGRPRLVLLDAPGKPRLDVEVEEGDLRAALDSLIA